MENTIATPELEIIINKNDFSLDQNSIGYTINGTKINEKSFLADIHNALESYQKGELKTFSNDEVRAKILG